LGARLEASDASNGGALGVSAVGDAVLRLLAVPHVERPNRIVVDSQNKGIEDLNDLRRAKQAAFFDALGIGDLLSVAPQRR